MKHLGSQLSLFLITISISLVALIIGIGIGMQATNHVGVNDKKPTTSLGVSAPGYDEIVDEMVINDENQRLNFYLDKLKDKTYTDTYGHGYTWYIAAEELGMLGKPAIPYLINKLDTLDDYERTQVLYALLLAAQNGNVKEFTNGEYVNEGSPFEISDHPELVKAWNDWFDKYLNYFNFDNDST